MEKREILLTLLSLLVLLTWSCSSKWTDIIGEGSIAQKDFRDTVELDMDNGLLFLPVNIEGKEYRFLFDSGAPFSISKELQALYNFEVISSGNIVDSDKNREKVDWARVDVLSVGTVAFENHSAFVGDFKANPILECLEIDGILGSNIMRQCQWTIDQEQKILVLQDAPFEKTLASTIKIPFKSNQQYSIYVDIRIGQAKLSHVLVDYGSNGWISLKDDVFTFLEERDIIKDPYLEKGQRRGGILGKATPLHRKLVKTDSAKLGGVFIDEGVLKTGKTTSIGNRLFSQYRVRIDWDTKCLLLSENGAKTNALTSPGFKLDFAPGRGLYVQSVIEESDASKKGLRPNMSVVQLDSLNFEEGATFCDYLEHKHQDSMYLVTKKEDGQKVEFSVGRVAF